MTTTTIRPNGTQVDGGATYTGGAGTFHGNTSDDSDASYATLTNLTSAILNLGTLTLNNDVVKQVRIRQRVRAVTGTGPSSVYLLSNGSSVAGFNQDATTTITTLTGSYEAISLSQTDLNALRLVATAGAALSASVDIRFVELYVDVVHATQPTVTIVAPTGTITTSAATVQWTYTMGSNGGPQSRAYIKVFDSATAGGGGFDPETSTTIYDSGELATSGTEATTDPLPSAANHVAYVKVAQTINGDLHWSAWDSQTFTVSTAAPSVTSVTPTPSNSTASIAIAVARNTGGAAWDAVTVQRSTDGGTTWEFVRGATADTASGNTYNVTDYEAANGDTVTYRARAHNGDEIGAWVSSGSTSWSSTTAWLKSPADPTLNRAVELFEAPEWSVSEDSRSTVTFFTANTTDNGDLENLLGPSRATGVFNVLGADHPVVVSDTGTALFMQFPSTWDVADRWVMVLTYSRRHVAANFASQLARLWPTQVVEVDRPPDTSSN